MKSFGEKCKEAICGVEKLPGWGAPIREIDEFISQYDPDYKVDQIKEKFGGLRFYFSLSKDHSLDSKTIDEIYRFVSEKEEATMSICEQCGVDSKQQNRNMWISTLCDDCYEQRQKELNNG